MGLCASKNPDIGNLEESQSNEEISGSNVISVSMSRSYLIASVGDESRVLFPDNPGFEEARTAVWNLDSAGMPIVIVKCISGGDVATTLKYAAVTGAPICVHTAGAHSNTAVVTDCVVIDLSFLRSVKVDASSSRVTVGGGVLIGDVDRACKPYGLALPMGHVWHTGVAGMVLNATSGVGFLSRTRGITATYLREATLVMYDGSIKTITEDDELFWALKGAGANFGVAIEMTFGLSKVTKDVFAGDIIKFGKGTSPPNVPCCGKTRQELVKHFFSFFEEESTPDECSSLLVLAGNGPVITRVTYIPKEQDILKPTAALLEESQEAFSPLISYGSALDNTTKMMDYWDGLQKLGEFPPSYWYQKASWLGDLSEDVKTDIIEHFCEHVASCPVNNMGTAIIIQPLAGKMATMPSDLIPTGHMYRNAKWFIVVIVQFPEGPEDPDLRDRCIKWVRDVYNVMEPHAFKDPGREKSIGKSGKLSNHQYLCNEYWYDVIGDIYGSNLQRLIELKRKYDPNNVFRMNRKIVLSQTKEATEESAGKRIRF